jgi:hypothetical protein
MGVGLAQLGILVLLTVVGLPLFFFGLLAALDRFERSLSDQPRQVASRPATSAPAPQPAQAVAASPAATEAAVMTLPVAPPATASQPAAAV